MKLQSLLLALFIGAACVKNVQGSTKYYPFLDEVIENFILNSASHGKQLEKAYADFKENHTPESENRLLGILNAIRSSDYRIEECATQYMRLDILHIFFEAYRNMSPDQPIDLTKDNGGVVPNKTTIDTYTSVFPPDKSFFQYYNNAAQKVLDIKLVSPFPISHSRKDVETFFSFDEKTVNSINKILRAPCKYFNTVDPRTGVPLTNLECSFRFDLNKKKDQIYIEYRLENDARQRNR